MAEQPTTASQISEWLGQASNVDPHNLPAGTAQSQNNCYSRYGGELNVRLGAQNIAALSSSGGVMSVDDIISTFAYARPDGDFHVTVDQDGDVIATLASSSNTIHGGDKAEPWSFVKARNGDLIGVNGYERGIRWDSQSGNAEELGIEAPDTAPTVLHPGGGAATANGDYTLAYRYVDDTLPSPIVSSLSPAATVEDVTLNDKFNWTGIPSSPTPESRVTHKELWRSVANQPNVLYYITTITVATTDFDTDTSSDQTLINNAVADPSKKLVILSQSGDVVGRRQGIPPFTKPVVAEFQDRMFYAGWPKYTTGTVAISGTTVTGSGTAWTSELAIGRYIYVVGATKPYKVSAFGSTTSITISETAAETVSSGAKYVLLPPPNERNAIFFSHRDEPESVHANNVITLQENVRDNDEIVGLIPFGSLMYVAKTKYIYSLSFLKQPTIDADIRLVSHRGVLNQRCWDVYEGRMYCMDRSGIYYMDLGGAITPISLPIQDIFRNDTSPLDWANSKWWFCVSDPDLEQIRFHVGYTADSSTRPMRALVYDVRKKAWHRESFVWELGGGVRFTISNQTRVVLAGERGVVLEASAGKPEFVTSEVRGTATAGASTTLTDSGASFSGLTNAPVAIIDGTGKHQVRRIASHSGTVLTVSPSWTTTPDTTSKYLVGGILWDWKSGVMSVPANESRDVQRITTHSASITAGNHDVRFYIDRSSTAQNWGAAQNTEGVKTEKDDPDAEMDESKSNGIHRKRFGGMLHRGHEGKELVELELRGHQGNSEVKIFEVEIEGVSSS